VHVALDPNLHFPEACRLATVEGGINVSKKTGQIVTSREEAQTLPIILYWWNRAILFRTRVRDICSNPHSSGGIELH